MEKVIKICFFGFMAGLWASAAPSVMAGVVGVIVVTAACAAALAMGDITK